MFYRSCLLQIRCRVICSSTQWINSNESEVCDHCDHLLSHTLCIDKLVKLRIDSVFNESFLANELVRARQKCINLYPDVMDPREWIYY